MIELRTNSYYHPYAIDAKGEVVVNLITGRRSKIGKFSANGYYTYSHSGTPNTNRTIHRFVCSVWNYNEHNHPIVNHIDHDKTNNHKDNLEWCTHAHNSQQAVIYGKMKLNCVHGEDNNWAVYSDEKVHLICKDIEAGMRNVDIQAKYNLSSSYIKHLKKGGLRELITKQYTLNKFDSRPLSDDAVHWVCAEIVKGTPRSEIISTAPFEGVSINVIKNIRRKGSYKSISDLYF
ncbi:MAG: hypothetical protein GY928_13185 [Colwellia sp.]|nr:hypothetical protein [Colwellia sp.]